MSTSNGLPADVQAELIRRHKSTATTVLSLVIAVILLAVLAFVTQKFLKQRNSLTLDMTFRIVIPILGLGAIALRRTRLAKMRLQDIAAIRGASGLLATLQKTALLMALIGIAVALLGFISTVMTGQVWYTYTAAVVAIAILLFYGYPLRPSWEQALKQYLPPPENSTNMLQSEV
jgi:hypothetical protein